MAIRKQKILNSGVSGNYWKIIKEDYDRLTGEIKWKIALFKDQSASDSNKDPLNVEHIFKKIITENEALGNRTQLGYNFIKQKSLEEVPMLGSNDTYLYNQDLANGEDV